MEKGVEKGDVVLDGVLHVMFPAIKAASAALLAVLKE